jgi:hypothetical protein
MGGGRIPGPYGTENIFGCVLNPGPIRLYGDSFGGFIQLTPGSMGNGSDLAAAVAESAQTPRKEDEQELKLLVTVYGIIKNKKGSKSYTYWKKKKKQYRIADYVKDRDRFFGSAKAFEDYRDLARTELDAEDAKLRRYIEPPPKVRKRVADWKKAQDVFYAWVRKAYENSLGENVDIPKLIKSQMSEKLKTALQQVKIDYGKDFQYGGFNPRPMKLGGYRFGTISEHGIGTALDIESGKNAHIETSIWRAILSFTGKSVNNSTSKWNTAPKELYDTIKEINDEFVSKLAKSVKDTEETVTKSAEATGATEQQKAKAAALTKDPLAAAIDQNAALKSIGSKFLREWQKGFFNLPWDLVKELHEEGFLWGATFSHPDLHHFEL